jgi:hypothetical protein
LELKIYFRGFVVEEKSFGLFGVFFEKKTAVIRFVGFYCAQTLMTHRTLSIAVLIKSFNIIFISLGRLCLSGFFLLVFFIASITLLIVVRVSISIITFC